MARIAYDFENKNNRSKLFCVGAVHRNRPDVDWSINDARWVVTATTARDAVREVLTHHSPMIAESWCHSALDPIKYDGPQMRLRAEDVNKGDWERILYVTPFEDYGKLGRSVMKHAVERDTQMRVHAFGLAQEIQFRFVRL